jgi:hypothetical protein
MIMLRRQLLDSAVACHGAFFAAAAACLPVTSHQSSGAAADGIIMSGR